MYASLRPEKSRSRGGELAASGLNFFSTYHLLKRWYARVGSDAGLYVVTVAALLK